MTTSLRFFSGLSAIYRLQAFSEEVEGVAWNAVLDAPEHLAGALRDRNFATSRQPRDSTRCDRTRSFTHPPCTTASSVRIGRIEWSVSIPTQDFRVVAEWPYADEQLAYLAPPTDDHFYIEVLGGGKPLPTEVRP